MTTNIMRCSHCGKQIQFEYKYCPYCGVEITEIEDAISLFIGTGRTVNGIFEVYVCDNNDQICLGIFKGNIDDIILKLNSENSNYNDFIIKEHQPEIITSVEEGIIGNGTYVSVYYNNVGHENKAVNKEIYKYLFKDRHVNVLEAIDNKDGVRIKRLLPDEEKL